MAFGFQAATKWFGAKVSATDPHGCLRKKLTRQNSAWIIELSKCWVVNRASFRHYIVYTPLNIFIYQKEVRRCHAIRSPYMLSVSLSDWCLKCKYTRTGAPSYWENYGKSDRSVPKSTVQSFQTVLSCRVAQVSTETCQDDSLLTIELLC